MGETVASLRPSAVVAPLAVVIAGKIAARKRHNGNVITEIRLRAPDEYTKPGVVSVRSSAPVGNVNDVVEISCTLGGYYGAKQTRTDRQTGEIEEWYPVRMTLDAIETPPASNSSF